MIIYVYFNVHVENLKLGSKAKVILITGRIHPGESPSSYVCEGTCTCTYSTV